MPDAPDMSLTVTPPLPIVNVCVPLFCCKVTPAELLKTRAPQTLLLPNLQVVPEPLTLLALYTKVSADVGVGLVTIVPPEASFFDHPEATP